MAKSKPTDLFLISSQRKIIFDYIRVISCIGIISLHATGERVDPEGIVLQILSRISLPMFVVLSGALALSSKKEEGYIQYYLQRCIKILIPYFIYNALYVGYFNLGHTIAEIPSKESIKIFLRNIPLSMKLGLESYQSTHLWFMLMIMGFYIVAPFLKKGLSAFDQKDNFALLGLLLITYAVIDYLPLFGITIGISNFFADWLSYALLGYILISIKDINTYKVMTVTGLLDILVMFVWKWKFPDHLSMNFYDLAPHMIIACCGVWSCFMLIEKYITKSKIINWIIVTISKYTFSIYLIHIVLLQMYINNNPDYSANVARILVATFVVFIQSCIIAFIFDNIITFNVQRIINIIISKFNSTKHKLA
ncbi:acyltransferase [Butyrivibrio sp. LC3010]|uniref:acyltransferase n=1 Tax=Butyrivibrio sp. LC3010 TaxID=1280680 RepID=UPI000410328B|nr:acyltransferase [Butyrivibrio sp. LC3010]